jgi:hypothetical protein
MTVWTPAPGRPGYEISDAGKMRSSPRLLPVVFRQPRVLGDSTPEVIVSHPHTEERDSSGSVVPPSRDIGPTLVNVMDYGAAGDGTTLDTNAFRDAFAALPAEGGTVYAPANDFLIDAEVSIKPPSHTRLLMDPGTRLLAKPNAAIGYSVILLEDVTDVEIDGGQVWGDRYTHLGTTGEGGVGVKVIGSTRVTVQNILPRDCWGDGLYVGGSHGNRNQSSDVVIADVVSTNNRRQGMSITNAHNVRTYRSEFSDTNGTAPQCGIDIEPNKETATGGTAQDIYFEDCSLVRNHSSGYHIQARSFRVTFKNCTLEDNLRHGGEAREVTTLLMDGCSIQGNGDVGQMAGPLSHDVTIRGCTFGQNNGRAPRSPPLMNRDGVVSGTAGDLSVGASPKSLIGNNYL